MHEPRPSSLTAPRFAALAPFTVRNFRFQWPADVATQWAIEMEVLILGWYVLTETKSVLLLTLYGALLYIGTLIAPLFGVAGDRIGHRNVLTAMRAVYAVLSVTLMLLAFADRLDPLAVLVIATLTGLVRPSDLGVRGALTAHIMPLPYLVAAMSISRTTVDSARVAGALTGAGLFAAVGIGKAYVLVAILYVVGVILTACVVAKPAPRVGAVANAPLPSPWRDLKEGLVYISKTPPLLAALWLAFLANLTAYPFTTGLMPYVAKEVYHVDQTGLGWLLASFNGGALAGSLALMLVGSRFGASMQRVMVTGAIGWFALLLGFAHAGGPAMGMTFLVLAGFAQSICMVSLVVVLMGEASAPFRGRVMGVRMLAIYGLPLGLLAAGAMVERLGFTETIMLYCGSGLACVALIALHWRVYRAERMA